MEEALISAFGDDQIETNENLVLPTQPMYGDYQSNIALTLTKKLSMKPKDIAEKIVKQLKVDDIASINITGPGFITMKLTNRYVQSQLTHKLNNPKRLGISIVKKPQRIVVDFSSPNIAKEMHVVNNLKIYSYIYLCSL
jgi:arginyl-tRNA synthetase